MDEGICDCASREDVFSYSLITDKQNYYMHHYDKVYRFLAEDKEQIVDVVGQTRIYDDIDFTIRVANREDNADASH